MHLSHSAVFLLSSHIQHSLATLDSRKHHGGKQQPPRKHKHVSYNIKGTAVDLDDADLEYHQRLSKQASQRSKAANIKAQAKERKKNQRSIKTTENKPFKFLSLPAEIRNMIYKLALIDADGIEMVNRTTNNLVRPRRGRCECDSHIRPIDPIYAPLPKLSQALLQFNLQVNSEATPTLYAQSISFDDLSSLHSFLTLIGAHHRALLTDITLQRFNRDRSLHNNFNPLLRDALDLQRFFIKLNHVSNTMHRLASIFDSKGYGWFRAYGAAKGRPDAILDILQLPDRVYGWCTPGTDEDARSRRQEFYAHLRAMLLADAGLAP